MKSTAIAHPNIAFIKYWGNQNDALRVPSNGSISMNLGALFTRTSVLFQDHADQDSLSINGRILNGNALSRVTAFLDIIREMAGETRSAIVVSETNFPVGAGIASSASAFAALSLAGSKAAGLDLNEAECSRLARCGSGSACRSIPNGFCEWNKGDSDENSFSVSIAESSWWNLIDLIAVVSERQKKVGSTVGHHSASTSPYQEARIATAPERIQKCRSAILNRDFEGLGLVSEADSTMMHAVMMTQVPPVFYWEPTSLAIMKAIPEWRANGLPCFFTLDAGPNIHVLCPYDAASFVQTKLSAFPGVTRIIRSGAGGGAELI